MKAKLFILTMILLAACQPVEFENPEIRNDARPAGNVYTLSLQANKAVDTKALDLVPGESGAPDNLDAYWKESEKVKVYKGGTLLGTLDVTPGSGTKPATATLSGNLTVTDGLATGDELTLMIPRDTWAYTGQVGTLASIETTYDYATAAVTVKTIDGSAITTTGSANFANQQSIYRFGFQDAGNSNAYINPKDFSVSAANGLLVQTVSYAGSAWTPVYGSLTVTPAAAPSDNFYYVSLRNGGTSDDTYNFIITDANDALYLASKAIPASVLEVPGKFISAKTISVAKPDMRPANGTISQASDVL